MIEQLEIVEETDCGADFEIISACRRQLMRLFVIGGGLVFGLGQAMSVLGAG
jgi:hypothetical protein